MCPTNGKLTPNVCPCGSGHLFAACCEPILDGRMSAVTPEALMRSRYTAYVLGQVDYLQASWHPETRPQQLQLDSHGWKGLKILATEPGKQQDEAYVCFVAYYEFQGQPACLLENSRFLKQQEHWLYVDGELKHLGAITRKQDCPCGSGKKFKRCCGGVYFYLNP